MNLKKVYITSDHAGFKLKEEIKKFLNGNNVEVIDLGPENENSVSYSLNGLNLAKVVKENNSFGIGVCGTGIGISIAVNRIKGIKGARVCSVADAVMAREHNDANILLFGGRITKFKKVKKMIVAFDNAKFQEGRHIERLKQLDA